MEQYKIIGLDLAKTKFHFAALNDEGKKVLSKQVLRDDLLDYTHRTFKQGSLIAMEACGGCHYWGQQFRGLGFSVKLLKPKDVKAYAKSKQKNDINDALAIAKAGQDPELKEVHLKDIDAQTISFLHKMRSNIICERIQKSNSILTTLLEFGVAVKVKKSTFAKEAAMHVKKAYEDHFIGEKVYQILLGEAKKIDGLLQEEAGYDKTLKELNKQNKKAKRLETIPGIGPINASILSIQPMESYETSRDYSASLGLVPKQSTTGGHVHLGSISKQGNRYIRTMLIQGARSVVMRTCKDTMPNSALYTFAKKLYDRKGFNVACVAVANKLARIAFACITKQKDYHA